MPRRWAVILGVLGYILVIWMYSGAFNLFGWEFGRDLLWYTCISCVSVTALSVGRLTLAFLLLAPINAFAYAVAGFLLGKLFQYLTGHSNGVSG